MFEDLAFVQALVFEFAFEALSDVNQCGDHEAAFSLIALHHCLAGVDTEELGGLFPELVRGDSSGVVVALVHGGFGGKEELRIELISREKRDVEAHKAADLGRDKFDEQVLDIID